MAEFNIFLGTARKSVGDITLYRRDGKQVARVRVRDIGNPKTEGQSETRNFLAPVIKFYAPLRKVLARSFEGLDKNRSYNEFQRINIRMARANQWYLLKGAPFTPMPYLLSRGSLKPQVYRISGDLDESYAYWSVPNATLTQGTIGELSQALINNGAKFGDVITLIPVLRTHAGDYYPYPAQFYVNPRNAASIDSLGGGVWSCTYEDGEFVFEAESEDVVALAVIHARPSAAGWLRSTQYMAVNPNLVAQFVSADAKAAAIASYGPNQSEGGGGVYPEDAGEPYNCQTISGRALLFYGGQYNAEYVVDRDVKYIKLKPANLSEVFFVKDSYGNILATNSAGSLAVSDWRWVTLINPAANDENTISAAPGTKFAEYLVSIGFTSIQ